MTSTWEWYKTVDECRLFLEEYVQEKTERLKASRAQAVETRKRRKEQRLAEVVRAFLLGKGVGNLTHCAVCDRALSDPESIARGIGSECWPRLMDHVAQARAREALAGSGIAPAAANPWIGKPIKHAKDLLMDLERLKNDPDYAALLDQWWDLFGDLAHAVAPRIKLEYDEAAFAKDPDGIVSDHVWGMWQEYHGEHRGCPAVTEQERDLLKRIAEIDALFEVPLPVSLA